MKKIEQKDKLKFFLTLLFFFIIALITFRCTLPSNAIFSASDLNFGRLAALKYELPHSLIGIFGSNQLIGGSGQSISFFKILLMILPLEIFANLIYPFILLIGSISMVWFLRIWKCCWISSIFGALVSLWFNSILLASAGHAHKMEVLVFSILSLALIEKSIRAVSNYKILGFALLAGLVIGIMMIEQQDVALLAMIFVGPYLLFRLFQEKLIRNRFLLIIFPITVVSLLLSGNTILNSYKKNILNASAVQGDNDQKWNYVTQWSMVPNELLDLIALGWSGWSSFHPSEPYWGKIGQSPEYSETGKGFKNFRLDNSYIGVIPIGFAVLSCFYGWRSTNKGFILFWMISALLALLLSFGKYSFIYEFFFKLPLFGNIRAPIKLLDNMQIAIGILAAFGLNNVLIKKEKTNKIDRIAFISFIFLSAIFFLMSLNFFSSPLELKIHFDSVGMSENADALSKRVLDSYRHVAIFGLIGVIIFYSALRKYYKTAGLIIILATSVDSIILTSNYFNSDNISEIRNGNVVINFLKKNQKNERSLFLDESGIYNRWIAFDGPYHDLNLFNIWQMPRMPKEYDKYLKIMGNDQFKLWELSSVRFLCMPEKIYEQIKNNLNLVNLEEKLKYQIPTSGSLRKDVIIENKKSIPRFSLYKNWKSVPRDEHCNELIKKIHDHRNLVLISSDSNLGNVNGNRDLIPLNGLITRRYAKLNIQTDSDSIIRFSQRYQPEWKVTVNGLKQPLLCIDYLSMGVFVPAGSHEIIFECIDKKYSAIFSGSIFILVFSFGIWCISRK